MRDAHTPLENPKRVRPYARPLLATVVGLSMLMLLPLAGGTTVTPHISGGGVWYQFHGDPTLDGVSGSGSTPTNATLFPPVDLTKYATFNTVTVNPFPYQASPVTDGSVVVVALGNYVLEFNANTGAPIPSWPDVPLPGGPSGGPVVGTPLITPGAVYVDQSGGTDDLVALYANNGTQMWVSAPTTCGWSCHGSASVTSGAGVVTVATMGGEIAWHPMSAGNLWNYQGMGGGFGTYTATPAFSFIAGVGASAFVAPTTGNGLMAFYAPPIGGNLPGFPVNGGTFGETLTSSAAVVNLTAGGTTNTWAFFGGDAGYGASSQLWAVDLSQPNVVSALTIPPLSNVGDGVWGTPVVVPSSISQNHAQIFFATADGQVRNASFVWNGGTQTGFTLGWSFQGPTAGFYASPVVDGNDVIVPASDAQGTVYAINTNTGTLDWSAHTGSPVYASPAASGGTIYIVTSAGMLYAFGYSPGSTSGGGGGGGAGGSASGSTLVYALLAVVVIVAIVVAVLLMVLNRKHQGHHLAGHHTPPPPATWSPPPPPSSAGTPPPPPPSSSAPPPPPPPSGSGVPPPPTTAEVGFDEPGQG